jgi:ankyrin repeat protein
VIRLLLERGAAVNMPAVGARTLRFPSGETPLHRASRSGNQAAVVELMNHGADLSLRDAVS